MPARPPTKPAAGVMATRPATMPEQAPRVVKCPSLIRSTTSQATSPAAAARNVFMNAVDGERRRPRRPTPELNPNQPNHRMPVPSSTSGRLCGRHGLLGPALALAEHQHHGEGGDAGVDVDGGAAGEVERAAGAEPADRGRPSRVEAVDPEDDRHVDQQAPDRHEHRPRRRTSCGRRRRPRSAPA